MSENHPGNRAGYHHVTRVRPSVAWVDPPRLPDAPEIDWAWVAQQVAEHPGRWLQITHPVPGRGWSVNAGQNTPHLAPFRPLGSHEGTVRDGYLYLRKRSTP